MRSCSLDRSIVTVVQLDKRPSKFEQCTNLRDFSKRNWCPWRWDNNTWSTFRREYLSHAGMIFHINVRFFLTVTVIASLALVGKMKSIFENPSGGTHNGTSEGTKETWIWLSEYLNETEHCNESNPWDKIHQGKGRVHENNEREMNWCMHLGPPFEKINSSRFQVCSWNH